MIRIIFDTMVAIDSRSTELALIIWFLNNCIIFTLVCGFTHFWSRRLQAYTGLCLGNNLYRPLTIYRLWRLALRQSFRILRDQRQDRRPTDRTKLLNSSWWQITSEINNEIAQTPINLSTYTTKQGMKTQCEYQTKKSR